MAESLEAEVNEEASVEAELGVDALLRLSQLLSMERRGLEGRPDCEGMVVGGS